ncbi:hypothetical protein ACLMJK_002145 [Lecanora helva]
MSTPSNKALEKSAQHSDVKLVQNQSGHPVDSRLERLKEKVLPEAPYILSCPGSLRDEFVKIHYPQNAINWRKYSLFKPDEEELQYLTFKDRSTDSDIRSMYTRGGWDDGKGRIAAPEEPFSRTSSDGTPRPGQPKKRITLAQYHTKDRSKATTPAPKPAPQKSNEETKSNNENIIQPIQDNKITQPQRVEHSNQKRPADTMDETKIAPSNAQPSSPPAKKARTSSESQKSPSTIQDESSTKVPKDTAVADNDRNESRKAPSPKEIPKGSTPRISDTRPKSSQAPHAVKPTIPTLPPMLSPLSSVVEEEILKLDSAARDNKATVSKANAAKMKENIAPATKQYKSTAPSKGPQEQAHVTSAPRQISKDTSLKSIATSVATPNGSPLRNKLAATPTPTPKATPPDPPKRIRLTVKLKIKKKTNRNTLHAYTRMQPTPGRNSLFPGRPIEAGDQRAGSAPHVESKNSDQGTQKASKSEPKSDQPRALTTGDKRRRTLADDDNSEPATKRKLLSKSTQVQKPKKLADEDESEPAASRKLPPKSAQVQKPITPNRDQTSSSAGPQRSSAQKPSTPTPNAQTNSATMLRAASGQGSVTTPQQSTVTETLTAPSASNQRSSYASPGKPKSSNLYSESKPWGVTARTLKHQADAYLKKQDKMTEEERKLGVLLGTESVLCFMFTFVLADTGYPYSDRTSWNSIIAFLVSLQRATEGIQSLDHLSGLLCQLEAVIRDQVSYADMQLLDTNPLKYERGKAASNASMSQEDKAAEYFKHFHSYHEHRMKADSAWRSGWVRLDVADLPSKFPETWAKRDKHRYAYGKGRDAVAKGEYMRKYLLPLNNMTSGLEAVNFGMSILTEWSRANNVEWKPQLIL